MNTPTSRVLRLALLSAPSTAVLILAGCANMSGLGGASDYGCKAPEGVKCDSVSGNYANALQNNLPSQRLHRPTLSPTGGTSTAPASARNPTAVPPAAPAAALMPQALRAQPRVLRLWVKPWEDIDHDLHDQSYVYVQTDNGHWLIDHAQRRIRDAYVPIRPPVPVPASTIPSDARSPAPPAAAPGNAAVTPLARAIDSLRERASADDDQ